MRTIHILDLSKGNAWHNFNKTVCDEYDRDENIKTYSECMSGQLSKFNATVNHTKSTVTFKHEHDYTWFLLAYS